MGIRCADHVTPLYPQKLALTSPTGGGRSVGIVRSRTKATEGFFVVCEMTWDIFVKYAYFCGVWLLPLLGAFAKLRKATISFVMSVRTEHLVTHRTNFHEFLYLSIFRKTVLKIQVSLKYDKNDGYF